LSKSRAHVLAAGTVSVLGLAAGSTQVQAQDEQAAESTSEVVITAKRQFRPEISSAASKLEMPVVETPQALTVLGSELLDIANLKDTASVVAYTAGIQNGGIGDGTEAVLVARGFEIDRERSYRVNGLSVYSEIDVDYFAMDRVEFVRGPASSLYGEADYGATVNRVLKMPTSTFGAEVGVQFGTDSYQRLEGDVHGPINDDGSLSYRGVAVVQDSEGFQNATEANHWLLAPSLRWAGDRTEVLLQSYFSQYDGPTSDGFPLVLDEDGNYALPDVPRDRNYGASTNDIDSSSDFFFGRVTHSFNDTLKLTFAGAFANVKMFNQSSYLCDCEEEGEEGDGFADLYYFLEDKDRKNTSFDLALEKAFTWGGREQRVLVSADWRQDKIFQPYGPEVVLGNVDYVNDDGPLQAERPDLDTGNFFDQTRKFSGISLLGYFKATDRLSMLVGLRQSKIRSRFTEVFDEEETSESGSDDAFVPRLGLVYNVAGSHYAFASYSEGVIFNETALDESRSPIAPETGTQVEFGVKGELFDKRVFYSVSAFTIDRTDLAAQIPDQLPGEPAIFYNVGEQTHQGVDVELQGEPIPGWNVFLSYAFLDVKIKESPDEAEVGNDTGDSPRNSLSLFTTYELLNGPLKTLTFGGGIVYRAERQLDSYATFTLPAYTRFDLRASYDFTEALTVEFNARNIFDEEIYTAAYASSMFGNGFSDVRSYTLGMSYRF
jgi:iron complex outermembrane recepter protein